MVVATDGVEIGGLVIVETGLTFVECVELLMFVKDCAVDDFFIKGGLLIVVTGCFFNADDGVKIGGLVIVETGCIFVELLIFVKDGAVVDFFVIGGLLIVVITGCFSVGSAELGIVVAVCCFFGSVACVETGNWLIVVIDIRCLYSDVLRGEDILTIKNILSEKKNIIIIKAN